MLILFRVDSESEFVDFVVPLRISIKVRRAAENGTLGTS